MKNSYNFNIKFDTYTSLFHNTITSNKKFEKVQIWGVIKILFPLSIDFMEWVFGEIRKREEKRKMPTTKGYEVSDKVWLFSPYVAFAFVFLSIFFFLLHHCWILYTPKPKTKTFLSLLLSKPLHYTPNQITFTIWSFPSCLYLCFGLLM